MKKHEAEKLIETIRSLIEPAGLATPPTGGATAPPKPGVADSVLPASSNSNGKFDEEAVYQRFRERFITEAQLDPILLRLFMQQPELELHVERRVETLDATTTRGRVARLIAQGWFATRRTGGNVRAELKRTGTDPGGGGALYDAINGLQKVGFLTKEGDGYVVAPGIKITEKQITTEG